MFTNKRSDKYFFFFKQKTAYEIVSGDWSSDVCSSDLLPGLDDPSDVDRLAEGYLRGLEVASRPELRHRCGDPPPAEPGSSADLLALIRKGGYSLPHVVGSCAMGPHPDDGAVVDSSGRVHGAERLNVADA